MDLKFHDFTPDVPLANFREKKVKKKDDGLDA